jgi:hypothetical protein
MRCTEEALADTYIVQIRIAANGFGRHHPPAENPHLRPGGVFETVLVPTAEAVGYRAKRGRWQKICINGDV